MANEVYTTDEVTLRDGTDVTLRPLAIHDLRKFMRIWGEYMKYLVENSKKPEEEQDDELEIGDRQFDTFLELCTLSLKEELQGNKSDESFREYIDKTLDEQTIYRVLDKCGGLKLNNTDPNPQTGPTVTTDPAGTN
jgi:hypothetical protein